MINKNKKIKGCNMFFKKESEDLINVGELISTPSVTLTKETKDEYTYPQDGWYWFDTEDEAYSFFGLEKEISNEYS